MNFLCIALPLGVRCTSGSILMAVISSNLLITVISIFLRSVYNIKDSRYRILYVFPAVILFRCIIPLEFSFSRIISLPRGISSRLGNLWNPIFSFQDKEVSAVMILLVVWGAGSLIKGCSYFHNFFNGRRYARYYAAEVTGEEPYRQIVEKICLECGKKNLIRIFKVDGLCIPALNGIVTPFLLLPKELDLIEEDLYYILKYHIVHYYQHSPVCKFLVNILEILFWWNPVVYLFKRQVGFFLDIQADETLTKGEKQVVCDYLSSRMRVLRFASQKSYVAKGMNLNVYIAELNDRFQLMMRKQEKKKWIPHYLILASLALAIFLLSYRFIPVAGHGMAEVETVWADGEETE